jgi:antibiotic biosynthesis monooxygenase (ABM) superfamily enzyme
VSITRRVDGNRLAEVTRWVQSGVNLANRWDGFLGSGWIRAAEGSRDWHMLYRFADAESLAAWEASPERAWWLEAAQGDVEESRRERRTGIEGWFDEPATVESFDAAAPAPPRWKQMVVIFLVFLPLSLTANFIASHTIADWALVPRVVLVTTVMTPLMTYVFLPWITRRMSWWLHR